jgi:hypothetical protein
MEQRFKRLRVISIMDYGIMVGVKCEGFGVMWTWVIKFKNYVNYGL